MDYETYKTLSEDEQKAFFDTLGEDTKKLTDQEAELNSLRAEIKEKDLIIENGKKDLAATKELNYTLARKVNAEPKKSFEETLHECFMGGKKNDN